MYTVLLVDDEQWILKDLRRLIDWEQHGFRIAGEAFSGTEAEVIAQSLKPDVIISDIRMPGMDGLALLRHISRKLQPAAVTVFISAYDDFGYAQEAIKLGAFDYILKPVKKAELIATLQRVAARLAEQQVKELAAAEWERSRSFVELLEQRLAETDIRRKLEACGLKLDHIDYRIVIIRTQEGADTCVAEQLGKLQSRWTELSLLAVRLGSRKWACIINNNNGMPFSVPRLRRLLYSLREQAAEHHVQIGVSRPAQRLKLLRDAFRQAETMAIHEFVTGKRGIACYSKQSGFWFEARMKRIMDADLQQLIEIAGQLRTPPSRLNVEGISMIQTAMQLRASQLYDSHAAEFDMTIGNALSEQELAVAFASMQEWLDVLLDLLRQREWLHDPPPRKSSSNTMIQEMLAEIESSYQRKLLIGEFAKQYHLNASYLSQLFKQETGESFTSRLVGVRMEKAAELLREGALTVHEISEKVGYDDYFHFSKLFKKHKQISPAAYRKQRGLLQL
ncbi:response regulator [Paenibacillus sp. GCM10027626]|uniref:response regulator n=1 Tax=Paenibacillus sp. GCM10027626 TaxID=3273411 RepID=UPI0036368903